MLEKNNSLSEKNQLLVDIVTVSSVYIYLIET